ncbi:MAG: feruloyl-CoA synthase [Proteobacteria bacterium]|nr:feruloyl-CoA synthase [Pseudomonadota bacterium]
MSASPIYRAARVGGTFSPSFDRRADGSLIIGSDEALGAYPARLTDRLIHWAAVCPERCFAAKRDSSGDWRRLSYCDALAQTRSIAEALLKRDLSAERPIVILSGNDLDHLLLSLAAMWAGIPYAPISTAYSLISQDYGKLRHIFGVLTPGLVFAGDGEAYGNAVRAVVPEGVEIVLNRGKVQGRRHTDFSGLLATPAGVAGDRAQQATEPDTIAKFLFTSGSTKLPKAVINTQRMLCSNQQMLLQCFPFVNEEPPVLVDWLPWNHTFGGNHNVGLVLYNGGTLYIDDGKPASHLIGETLRNLREIPTTIYFNVPKGFEEIVKVLESDAELQKTFFYKVKAFMFAGAGLSQAVWDRLDHIAEQVCGERIRMLTGLGMTETAPFALCANGAVVRSGVVGLPAPGLEVKLAPEGDKHEVRYCGPSVTPGYWRAPEQTDAAFDEENFFRSGDALKFIDETQPTLGLMFDGRIAEDFKLSTGTFVSVGPLRAKVIVAGAPYVQDVVITAPDRNDVGILIFPFIDECRKLAGCDQALPPARVLAASAVRKYFQDLVDRLYADGTGSANRIVRARLIADSLSIDRGEVTDKGSINQRAVLAHRTQLVDAMYDETDADLILAEH